MSGFSPVRQDLSSKFDCVRSYAQSGRDLGQPDKGQLISKCLYEVIFWTKIPTKNLIYSALKVIGQTLSNFLLVFWSKRFFQKDILKLTDL